MNRQKSQITMLMIAGLAIFIAVSLVFYLSKSSIKKQGQQSIKTTQQTALDSQPIKEFVEKCIDKLAKDSLVMLGNQGGYIYKSQGGTQVDYQDTDEGIFFVRHDNLKVAYNELPPKFSISPYYSEVPKYPWDTFPYETASGKEIYDGFFGVSNLPPLTPSGGPNSIQAQIESYIDGNLHSCADFNIFENQGYNITLGKSLTQVTIGTKDLSINTKVPVKIQDESTKETFQVNAFSASIDANLLNSYFLAKNLIESDIKNIKFEIKSANYNNLHVSVSKNFFIDNSRKIKADLVILTDDDSLVLGKPLQYTFAIRNRAPALHYINQSDFSFPDGYLINQSDIIKSPILADDPDGDSTEFKIYDSQLGTNPAVFPIKLVYPQMKFRVEVTDGQLSDYQVITVNKI